MAAEQDPPGRKACWVQFKPMAEACRETIPKLQNGFARPPRRVWPLHNPTWMPFISKGGILEA